jgi:hypothetical protein
MLTRLASKIASALVKLYGEFGAWNRLEKEILAANGGRAACRIDRRSLEKLTTTEFDKVRLTLPQLVALDRFLVMNNFHSLLHNERGLIDGIAESLEIVFVVAARFSELLADQAVAGWDLRCVQKLLSTRLGRLQSRIFDVQDRAEWEEHREEFSGSAQIFIGSQAANPGVVPVFEEMLHLDPDAPQSIDALPFLIVSADRDKETNYFLRRRREAAQVLGAAAVADLEGKHRALILDGEVFIGTDTEDYALIVAQRDAKDGHIRVVLSGLRGPGTGYLGEILKSGEPPLLLPPVNRNQTHLPIQVTAYRLKLEPGTRERGRERWRVANAALVRPPQLIEFVDGRWRFDVRGPDDPPVEET